MGPVNWGIIGNQAAVASLRRAMAQGRLPHALLLAGPPGVGKRTLALAVARAVNCPADGPPCLACSACRRIGEGLHPDVALLDPGPGERDIGIDRIKELQHDLSLRPFEGASRVAVVRGAHRMSREAANALLKTLEEPPGQAVLLLTTEDEDGLLPTIRSRCQRVPLLPVARAELQDALVERCGVALDEAIRLAALAQGCPGRALSAMASPGWLEEREVTLAALRSALEGDAEARLETAAQLAGARSAGRERLTGLLDTWRTWWRDLLLYQTGCTGALVYLDREPDYRAYAPRLDVPQARAALELLAATRDRLERNANPRLTLDVLLLGLPRPR